MISQARNFEEKDRKKQSQIHTNLETQNNRKLSQFFSSLKMFITPYEQKELEEEFEAMKQAFSKNKTIHVTFYSKTTEALYKYMVNKNTQKGQLSNIQENICFQNLYSILRNSITFAFQSKVISYSQIFQSINQLFVIYHCLQKPINELNQFDRAYDFFFQILRKYSTNEQKFITEVINLRYVWDEVDCFPDRQYPQLLNTVFNYILIKDTVQYFKIPSFRNQTLWNFSYKQKRNLCFQLLQKIQIDTSHQEQRGLAD